MTDPASTPGWRHLHPLTPWFRGGVSLIVVIGAVLSFAREDLMTVIEFIRAGGVLWAVLGILAIVLVVTGYSLVWWHFARFRVGADKVELRTGFVFRQHRSFRLDQLEAVDVVHPLVARILGLAKLTLESAGGEDSKLELSYLAKADAEAIRGELLGRRAAPPPPTGESDTDFVTAAAQTAVSAVVDMASPAATATPEEKPLFQVPPQWTIRAFLRTPSWWILAILGLALTVEAIVLAFTVSPELLSILVGSFPLVVGAASLFKQKMIDELWFTGFTHPDGLRLRHGLTTTVNQTVPAARIQAVKLTQRWLWRKPNWWSIEINVAGYAASNAQGRTTLVPVADPGLSALAIGSVMPEAVEGATWELIAAAMGFDTRPDNFTGPTSRARMLDPLTWACNGFATSDFALIIRRGRLRRRVEIVPHRRIQQLRLRQGPLERRLGLADVAIRSMPGPVTPAVRHLDSAKAGELLLTEAPKTWFPQVRPGAQPSQ
jgi:putative membrane protein